MIDYLVFCDLLYSLWYVNDMALKLKSENLGYVFRSVA